MTESTGAGWAGPRPGPADPDAARGGSGAGRRRRSAAPILSLRPAGPRRLARSLHARLVRARTVRAATALKVAMSDLQCAGLRYDDVRVIARRARREGDVLTLAVRNRVYRVRASTFADCVAGVMRVLQLHLSLEGKQWPTVPTWGVLRPDVRDGCAVWLTPDGREWCEVGQLFARDAPVATPRP